MPCSYGSLHVFCMSVQTRPLFCCTSLFLASVLWLLLSRSMADRIFSRITHSYLQRAPATLNCKEKENPNMAWNLACAPKFAYNPHPDFTFRTFYSICVGYTKESTALPNPSNPHPPTLTPLYLSWSTMHSVPIFKRVVAVFYNKMVAYLLPCFWEFVLVDIAVALAASPRDCSQAMPRLCTCYREGRACGRSA